jgi:5-formyltetrahydrofolate cyclo-ligase
LGDHARDHLQPVSQQKRTLRQQLRSQRQQSAQLPASLAAQAAVAIADQLATVIRWPSPGWVAVFAPLPGEIDPGPLAARAQQAGSTLCYPRIVNPQDRAAPPELAFHTVARPSDLAPAAHGIHEPAASAPLAPDIDIFITPGLGFDAHGNRLGAGRGYYDAALRRYPAALRVGIGHDWQLLPAIPVEPHDETLDLVATPGGCRYTQSRPAHRLCLARPTPSDRKSGVITDAEPPMASLAVQKEEPT